MAAQSSAGSAELLSESLRISSSGDYPAGAAVGVASDSRAGPSTATSSNPAATREPSAAPLTMDGLDGRHEWFYPPGLLMEGQVVDYEQDGGEVVMAAAPEHEPSAAPALGARDGEGDEPMNAPALLREPSAALGSGSNPMMQSHFTPLQLHVETGRALVVREPSAAPPGGGRQVATHEPSAVPPLQQDIVSHEPSAMHGTMVGGESRAPVNVLPIQAQQDRPADRSGRKPAPLPLPPAGPHLEQGAAHLGEYRPVRGRDERPAIHRGIASAALPLGAASGGSMFRPPRDSLRSVWSGRASSTNGRAGGSDAGGSVREQGHSSRSPRSDRQSQNRPTMVGAPLHDMPARSEAVLEMDAMRRQMRELEAAAASREDAMRGRQIEEYAAFRSELAEEREYRVQAQRDADWYKDEADRKGSEFMNNGLGDVIEMDGMKQERDIAQAQLRALGEEHAAYVRAHPRSVAQIQIDQHERTLAECQSQHDRACAEFQEQSNQAVTAIHATCEEAVHNVAVLQDELRSAQEMASVNGTQAEQFWRDETRQEREMREAVQDRLAVATAELEASQDVAGQLRTAYYEQGAELERVQDQATRVGIMLTAADAKAAQMAEEIVVLQARALHAGTLGAGPTARAPAPSAGSSGGLRTNAYHHPLLFSGRDFGGNTEGAGAIVRERPAALVPGHGVAEREPSAARIRGVGDSAREPSAALHAARGLVTHEFSAARASNAVGGSRAAAHGGAPQTTVRGLACPDASSVPCRWAQSHVPGQDGASSARFSFGAPAAPTQMQAPALAAPYAAPVAAARPPAEGHASTMAAHASHTADQTKRREAEHITAPPMPTVVNVSTWKREMREVVAAASANPDLRAVYKWMSLAEEKLEDPEATLGFEQCPVQFRTLDSKLLHALAAQIKRANLPSLLSKHHELSERALARDTVPSGRMLYYTIIHHLRVSNGLELRNCFTYLQELKWPGDEHMERFANVVNEYAREAIKDGIDERIIMNIIWEKMRASKALAVKIALFEMRTPDDPERSWQGLVRIINDRVELDRNEKLRAERTAGVDKLLRGGTATKPLLVPPQPVAAATDVGNAQPEQQRQQQAGKEEKTRPQGPPDPAECCWDFNHGGCRRTDADCRWLHKMVKHSLKRLIPMPKRVQLQQQSNDGAKGEPPNARDKGRGKGNEAGKGGKGKQGQDYAGGQGGRGAPRMCAHFQAKGACQYENECFNLHGAGMVEIQRAQNARAARDAARAAARDQPAGAARVAENKQA